MTLLFLLCTLKGVRANPTQEHHRSSIGATVGRDMNAVPGRDLRGVHLAMEVLHGKSIARLRLCSRPQNVSKL